MKKQKVHLRLYLCHLFLKCKNRVARNYKVYEDTNKVGHLDHI